MIIFICRAPLAHYPGLAARFRGLIFFMSLENWGLQPMLVALSSRERIVDGPVIQGNWGQIKKRALNFSRYNYSSPPLAQLIPDKEFRHAVRVSTYLVIQSQVQEARTGRLVWARARKTQVSLAFVVEDGMERSTVPGPVISQRQDQDFGDTAALTQRGMKRRRWRLPVGLRWH